VKAMVLDAFKPIEERPLALTDVPRPTPGPKEVLVRVSHCGVCRTDLHTVEGDIIPSKMPVIPGHQTVGTVEQTGEGVARLAPGQRIGLAWLARTCEECPRCKAGHENLCDDALFNGFDVDGGYAEYTIAHEDFAYPIPDGFSDEQAAPLLCAGIIGYRALRRAGAGPGRRVGLYGFGASAHVAIQVAVHWGCDVYVVSRSESHRALAETLGAVWTGGLEESPPVPIDSSVIFAPAGSIVPGALRALERGGTVALAGIHMTPIPEMDYEKHLYYERTLTSVTASTRRDGIELLELAGEIPVRTETTLFPLEEANEVLRLVKQGSIDGAAVLKIG